MFQAGPLRPVLGNHRAKALSALLCPVQHLLPFPEAFPARPRGCPAAEAGERRWSPPEESVTALAVGPSERSLRF